MTHLPRKHWSVAPALAEDAFNAFPELPPVVVQVLHNRGITSQEAIDEFLFADYTQHVHDPFGFSQMRTAVDRIRLAIKKKEKIVVYGDYDGDGICGSAIMYIALKALGAQDVQLYLPHRATEGYGLNTPAVEKFAAEGHTLLISVDCGTTSVVEIGRGNELGIDTIVVDHHTRPAQLPAAHAIINPSFPEEPYPCKLLSGGGTAFKVAQALFADQCERDGELEKWEREEKWLLDLVAISTVMDMIPLVGESRTLVKYGMLVLKKTRRPGLKKMYQLAGVKPENIDTRTIGFVLGPRLNAAGRLNHASVASNLLLTQNEQEAEQLAAELESSNVSRQDLMRSMINEAKAQIGTPNPETKLLSAMKPGWEAGVVGLVAGRIMDQFGLPAIIMGVKPNGDIIGSGRSVEQFNITAALQQCGDYLREFGGHPQACGFTVKSPADVEPFVAKMQELARQSLQNVDIRSQLLVDAEVRLRDIGWELLDSLQALEPFGQKAPMPLFVCRGVSISGVEPVGAEGKHARLTVTQDSVAHKAIAFGFGEYLKELQHAKVVDVVCELGINQWNGNREIQIKVVDLSIIA